MPVNFGQTDTKCDSNDTIVLPLHEDSSRIQFLVLERAFKERSNICFSRIGFSYCEVAYLCGVTPTGW